MAEDDGSSKITAMRKTALRRQERMVKCIGSEGASRLLKSSPCEMVSAGQARFRCRVAWPRSGEGLYQSSWEMEVSAAAAAAAAAVCSIAELLQRALASHSSHQVSNALEDARLETH